MTERWTFPDNVDDGLVLFQRAGVACAPCAAHMFSMFRDGPMTMPWEHVRAPEECVVIIRVYLRFSASLGRRDNHLRYHKAQGHADFLYDGDLA